MVVVQMGQMGQMREELTAADQEYKEELCQLLQHQALMSLMQEEIARAQESKGETAAWKVASQAGEEIRRLEESMREREPQVRSLQVEPEPEVLQTRVISLEEVRRDIQKWVPAFKKERDMLLDGPVKKVTNQEYLELGQKVDVELLPMKAVASEKPEKLKGRLVVCGNYSEEDPFGNTSVGGIDSVGVRTLTHTASMKGWELGTVDVQGAFLQADRRVPPGRVTVVEPPSLLRSMGLTSAGEKWVVNCALYGFMESPADWGFKRDTDLRAHRWVREGRQMSFRETAERHVWKVMADAEVVGFAGVYVDDFLLTASHGIWQNIMDQVTGMWKCGEPDRVSNGPVRFCGYIIEKAENGKGYLLGQQPYLMDVLKRRKVTGTEQVPLPVIEDADDESEEERRGSLKEAQSLVGELGWLATRTRPDISYGVGLLSRLTHRRPEYVVRLSNYMLRYLNGTIKAKLRYQSLEDRPEEWSHLSMPWTEDQVEVYIDTSYAPPHEKYRSVQGIAIAHAGNLLAWESSRQSFVTQSTAESELVGYNEGFQVTESVCALLGEFGWAVKKVMYGDSKAALSQLTCETGSWRTRHLRVRAAKMREVIQSQDGDWRALHLSGLQLIADGFTKSLQGQAFARYRQKLQLLPETDEGVPQKGAGVKKLALHGGDEKCGSLKSRMQRLAGCLGLAAGALVGGQHGLLGTVLMLCAVTIGVWSKRASETVQQLDSSAGSQPSMNMLKVKVEVEQIASSSEQAPLRPGTTTSTASRVASTSGTPGGLLRKERRRQRRILALRQGVTESLGCLSGLPARPAALTGGMQVSGVAERGGW